MLFTYKSQKSFLDEKKCMWGWNPQKPAKQDVPSLHVLVSFRKLLYDLFLLFFFALLCFCFFKEWCERREVGGEAKQKTHGL